MPIYEYQCDTCRHCFEKLVFAGDTETVTCPKCRGVEVKKRISCASFIGASGLSGCAPGTGRGFS